MTPFNRPGRERVNSKMAYAGRGYIQAALFDLGIYPAAIPSAEGTVSGELYQLLDPIGVLETLDEIEGYRPAEPERSLYIRVITDVTRDDGGVTPAWAYFYNAPLGRAQRIQS